MSLSGHVKKYWFVVVYYVVLSELVTWMFWHFCITICLGYEIGNLMQKKENKIKRLTCAIGKTCNNATVIDDKQY